MIYSGRWKPRGSLRREREEPVGSDLSPALGSRVVAHGRQTELFSYLRALGPRISCNMEQSIFRHACLDFSRLGAEPSFGGGPGREAGRACEDPPDVRSSSTQALCDHICRVHLNAVGSRTKRYGKQKEFKINPKKDWKSTVTLGISVRL